MTTPIVERSQATFTRLATSLLGATGAAGVALSHSVPSPWAEALQAGGLVAATVAGVGGGVPKVMEGKPVLQGAAAAVAGAAASVATVVASALPEGPWQYILQGLALLGAWLAGKQATFGKGK